MANYPQGIMSDEAQLTTLTLAGSGSTPIVAIGRIVVSITPAAVGAASTGTTNVVVQGIQVGDILQITPPGITAGVAPVCAACTLANRVSITFMNATAGSLTPVSGNYQILVMR